MRGQVIRCGEEERFPPDERIWQRATVFLAGTAAWVFAFVLAFMHRWLWMGVSLAAALIADRVGRVWSHRSPVPFPYGLHALLFFPRPFLSPARVRKLLRLQGGERILEIGAGVGTHALPVAASLLPGGALEAVDVQPQMLAELERRAARRRLTNIHRLCVDARRLPYPSRSFDAAYLIGVLGEIPQPTVALRELRRVLKEDGRLLIGEVFFDPDFIPYSRLAEMGREAGLTVDRKAGPGFAYCAVFQPTPTPALPQDGSPASTAAFRSARKSAQSPPGEEGFIPALGHHCLTPLYDPLQRWLFRESTFKPRLVELAAVQAGQRVLDLGCGTATLTLLLKRCYPRARVVGLDADPLALAIARRKAAEAGVSIAFEQGLASRLPYPDGSFDRVLSSLMFHHLTRKDKRRAVREVLRVLRPGGTFLLADLGRPHTLPMRLISLLTRRMEEAADNVAGLLPGMLADSGFEGVEEAEHFSMPYGTLSVHRARKAPTRT